MSYALEKEAGAYLNAMECMKRSLSRVKSLSKGRMWLFRRSGEVCANALDLVMILTALLKDSDFAKGRLRCITDDVGTVELVRVKHRKCRVLRVLTETKFAILLRQKFAWVSLAQTWEICLLKVRNSSKKDTKQLETLVQSHTRDAQTHTPLHHVQ